MLELEGKAGIRTQSPPLTEVRGPTVQGDTDTELASDRDSLVSQSFLNSLHLLLSQHCGKGSYTQ